MIQLFISLQGSPFIHCERVEELPCTVASVKISTPRSDCILPPFCGLLAQRGAFCSVGVIFCQLVFLEACWQALVCFFVSLAACVLMIFHQNSNIQQSVFPLPYPIRMSMLFCYVSLTYVNFDLLPFSTLLNNTTHHFEYDF